MPAHESIHEVLLKYWGYSHFRPLQEDIINSVLAGNDTLALMPTGGGKSICFQVPALAKEGICIVVSPLISLMKDQVENLRRKGIKAVAVISGMSRREIDIALDNCIHGNVKFLYLSPERLGSDLAIARLQQMKVNLIAVDEAHCVSQWGYDFRPSYFRIADIRGYFPEVSLLALTATATLPVRKDIMKQLAFKKANVFSKSFERRNLSYLVYDDTDKMQRIAQIVSAVKGSSVIYVRNRRKTKEVAEWLGLQNIKATFYHAGLLQNDRTQRQHDWMANKVQVMVATNAFGMGIDKPDVRTVIHLDMPESLEAYYQEAGRAGRDEKNAFAVLLFNSSDRTELERMFENTFPGIKAVKSIYNALGNYLRVAIGGGQNISFAFDVADFANTYSLNVITAISALKMLGESGYIALTEGVLIPSRLKFIVGQMDLYNFQVQQAGMDKFIKTILRSYGGVFDNYVKINEQDLGRKLGMSYDQVVKTFLYLQQHEILEYLQQTDRPQLTYLAPRLRTEDVELDLKVIDFRKERFHERAAAMLNYAENKAACRNMMLLAYFGETVTQRCGTCDYCRLRNKLELNDVEFDAIKEKIKEMIIVGDKTFDQLIKKVPATNVDNYSKALQWLFDTGVVIKKPDEVLMWNE